jgi:hypothetical protein
VGRVIARAVAAYFSDVLLWLSVAGALEVVAVVGMALLCILSAGYFFDHMKKNPVVLVLGGVVALAGTFLMFREVRSMIFPPPAVAVPQTQAPPSTPPPDRGAPPPQPSPSKEAGRPLDLTCIGLSQLACQTNLKCIWSPSIKMCMTRPLAQPPPGWNFPSSSSYQFSTCTLLPASACKETKTCYWSSLFNRCERLLVGTGLGAAKPPAPICSGLSEPRCKSQPGCVWLVSACATDLLKPPQ